MIRHDVFYQVKRWWKQAALIGVVLGGLATGVTYGGNVVSGMDGMAERYISAKVDKRIECLLDTFNGVSTEVFYMRKTQESNNQLLRELILVISKNRGG